MAVPTPISGLPSATPASGDLAVIVHSGVTSKTTLGDILDLVNVPVTSVAGRTGAVVLVSTDITDSTSIGRAVLTALDAASARTAIGAGVGNGNALTSGTLAQFAATTSAELAGVLTDETGSGGGFVRATGPTIATPTISGMVRWPNIVAGDLAGLEWFQPGSFGSRLRPDTAGNLIYFDTSAGGSSEIARVRLLRTGGIDLPSGSLSVGATGDGAAFSINALRYSTGDSITVNTWRQDGASLTPRLSVTAGVVTGGVGTAVLRLDNTRLLLSSTRSAAAVPVTIQGAASQVGSLTEWQTSAGTVGVSVAADATTLTAILLPAVFTVGTLPSASANAGRIVQVTDSNSTTNGNTVAGGGANRVPVFSNGTNWIVK